MKRSDSLNGNRKITRSEISKSCKQGKYLLINNSKVYDVTSWAPRHPGGELVLRHLKGRDATDQIRINHSDKVLKRMEAFCIGDFDGQDPSVDQPVSLAFRDFHSQLTKDGFYDTNFWFYALCYARFLACGILSVLTVLNYGDTVYGATIGAILMGLFWQQMAFVAHDSGHNGVTHNRKIDGFFGIILGNLLGGISIGWWKGSHNVHHIVTNDPEHDPDIQLLPFLAVTERLFYSVFSTFHNRTIAFDRAGSVLVSIQHLTYYPLMMLGRFNLYRESFLYLLTHRTYLRWLEVLSLCTFWVWYLSLVSCISDNRYRLLFILVSHIVTFILHVQITLSHFAMSTEPMKKDEEFIRYQLRTTLDVECPEWLDFFHGGLQFQLAHHLFPRIPRHNLRRCRDRIVGFCKQHNLKYNAKTFSEGNMFVIRHLRSIANQVQFYAHVAWDNGDVFKPEK